MSILVLGRSFEEKSAYIAIRKYIDLIKGRFSAGNENFKNLLKEIEKDFREETQVLNEVGSLNLKDLEFLNQRINKFNTDFDKLNSECYDKNYYDDGELKQLFSSISRQAHKIETTSRKYLLKSHLPDQTETHIKEGLAEFSKQALLKKL